MSKFVDELVQNAREALAIARGEMQPAGGFTFDAPDVAAIRKRLKLRDRSNLLANDRNVRD